MLVCGACAAGGVTPDRADGGGGSPPDGPRADARQPPPLSIDAAPGGEADAAPQVGDRPVHCAAESGLGPLSTIACVPEGMEGKTGNPAPLVVVLHGYTQDPHKMLDATEWDVLAGRYGFYVVVPQASVTFRAWYWYTSGRSRGQADPAAVIAAVDAMKARHDIDPERVFVTGFSAGGYMAVNLLADYPEVFAAGAATSGGAHGCGVLCPSAPSIGAGVAGVHAEYPAVWGDAAARKPRLMVMHGDRDGVNVLGNVDQLVAQWTGALGIDGTPDNAALGVAETLKGYPYAVYADGAGTIAVAVVKLEGLGHGVPVDPGEGVDQGGYDEKPSETADDCYTCAQDWTNTGSLYGAYYEAAFFGLTD